MSAIQDLAILLSPPLSLRTVEQKVEGDSGGRRPRSNGDEGGQDTRL